MIMQTQKNSTDLQEDQQYHVLVVDDDATLINYLQHLLQKAIQCKITSALSAEEGIALLQASKSKGGQVSFDVILLDVNMPGMDGISACQKIRENPCYRNIPIIMVTGDKDPVTLEHAFDAGATDFVTKPVVKIELMARLRTAFEQHHLRKELERMAFHDPLTGLANRSLLEERIELELANFRRNKIPFALLYIDLDQFKPLNDQLGHKMGDLALVEISRRLNKRVRAVDIVARIGGDEFVVLLTEVGKSNQGSVCRVAEELIECLQAPIPCNNTPWQLGASVGIAICPDNGSSIETLFHAADEAMYIAKNAGGDGYHLSSRVYSA